MLLIMLFEVLKVQAHAIFSQMIPNLQVFLLISQKKSEPFKVHTSRKHFFQIHGEWKEKLHLFTSE